MTGLKTTTVLQDSLVIKMKKVLFVCTGNTCRSPMAQAVFNILVKDSGVELLADSCGLYADGSPISENSKKALFDAGIDFDYISKPISEKLVSEADYIFGITRNHGNAIITMFPDYADKVYAFPMDISDPFGGNLETYKACLTEISKGVHLIFNKLTETVNE